MRIIFMGTPEFAAASLEALIREHEVLAVISQPDKPRGRGKKIEPQRVVKLAAIWNIPVFQYENLSDSSVLKLMEELKPDLNTVVAYGKILPAELINAPRFGTVNVHASLLPRWRGAAPIQYAILNGDTYTGVTVQQMVHNLDEGGIISQRRTDIPDRCDYNSLYNILKKDGAELLVETLRQMPLISRPQTGEVSYAPQIRREDCFLDLSDTSENIHNRIRALSLTPGARISLGGVVYKVYKSHVGSDGVLTLKCGDGSSISLDMIQAPGGKIMQTEDYLRGHTINIDNIDL